jgi:lactate dehydrogenase-like 2-hydroxyacid dehydrogenase
MSTQNLRPLVLVTHAVPLEWLQSLTTVCELVIGPADTAGFSDELMDRLPEAQGLFTLLVDRVDARLLNLAPQLQVISNMAVGVDNIDLAACTSRGIPVGNTPGLLTDATADLTMALLLAAARRLPEAMADARNGKWKTWSPAGWLGADFQGATLGILGMGRIGAVVARRAAGFGLAIRYADPTAHPEIDREVGARRVEFEELLHQSDFISLHVPLTPETRHLIGIKQLREMKAQAILVNTARGPVIDMDALVTALQEGWIAGAALDVTDPEPLPPDHPLFALNNCLIVPHIGSATHGTRKKMAELACTNLLAGLRSERLPFCANPEVYSHTKTRS